MSLGLRAVEISMPKVWPQLELKYDEVPERGRPLVGGTVLYSDARITLILGVHLATMCERLIHTYKALSMVCKQ